jgi:hypothetical protein
MHVLKDHQNRTGMRQSFYLGGQRLQRLLASLLRAQYKELVSSIVLKREHLRQ